MKNHITTLVVLAMLMCYSCSPTEQQQQQLIFVNKLNEPIELRLFTKEDRLASGTYAASTLYAGTRQLSNYTLKPEEEYRFYSLANDGSKPNTVFFSVFDSLKITTTKYSVVFKPNLVTNYKYNIYEPNEGWTYKNETYTLPRQFTSIKVISDNHYFTFRDSFFR